MQHYKLQTQCQHCDSICTPAQPQQTSLTVVECDHYDTSKQGTNPDMQLGPRMPTEHSISQHSPGHQQLAVGLDWGWFASSNWQCVNQTSLLCSESVHVRQQSLLVALKHVQQTAHRGPHSHVPAASAV